MSYNIDRMDRIAGGDLRMRIEDYRRLAKSLRDTPEGCFLKNELVPGDDGFVVIQHLAWVGEGSGCSVDVLIDDVLPLTTGSADFLLTWEGGDSFSGIRARDGVVTCHQVVMALGGELDDDV